MGGNRGISLGPSLEIIISYYVTLMKIGTKYLIIIIKNSLF